MSTTWTNENLNDYLDERLSPAEREELETIIRKDAVAIETLRELRRLRVSLRKAPRFKLNQDFAARVLAGLKQTDEQPLLETIDKTTGIDSDTSPATAALASSLSASTWRSIAITMMAIAASLLLILIIRPDLSARDNLADLPRAIPPGTNRMAADETNGHSGAAADVGNSVGRADPDSNGSRPGTDSIQVPIVSNDRPSELELPMAPGRSALSGDVGHPDSFEVANANEAPAPGMPLNDTPVDSESEGQAAVAVAGPDAEPRERGDVAMAENKDIEEDSVDTSTVDSSPFRFDEVVFVVTTQNHIDTMVSVLNDDLNRDNSALAMDRSASDSALHLQTLKGLGGGNASDGADDKQDPLAQVPQTQLDADQSTVVMSVQATAEQLDDFLTQFGAPVSRIVEPLPKQIVSFNLLSPTYSIPNATAENGAGMSPGGDASAKESADLIAITILDAAVLSRKQTELDKTRPKPAPPEKAETPSTPVVRRYLIVLKTTEPETTESVK